MSNEAAVPVKDESMPAVGLGLWKIAAQEVANVVESAIELGYRHLDSAADYGNEEQVGNGIRAALEKGLCSRDELWVTSKLWNTHHAAEHVREACERSLKDLQLDYLDLYLIHFPISLKHVPMDKRYPPEWIYDPQAPSPSMELAAVPLHETWRAMEELVEAGLVKQIGVCNYNSALLHDLHAYAKIAPAMLQIEAHPYLNQNALLRTAQDYGMAVTAFSPFGSLSYVELDMATTNESILQREAVVSAANRTGRSPAQVVLRWGLQRGTGIIPKSCNPARLAENLAIFDFSLTESEMDAISALNANRRFNDPGNFCEAAFGRFHAIYD